MFEVEIEHALEQSRPTYARRSGVRVLLRGPAGLAHRMLHDRSAQVGVRGAAEKPSERACKHARRFARMSGARLLKRSLNRLLDALQHQSILVKPDLVGDGADAEHRLDALAQVVEIVEDERAGRAADGEYVELACEQAFVVAMPS